MFISNIHQAVASEPYMKPNKIVFFYFCLARLTLEINVNEYTRADLSILVDRVSAVIEW